MADRVGLSDQQRKALLDRVRLKDGSANAEAAVPAAAPAARDYRAWTDFTTLPGYDQLVTQGELGDVLGTRPYFVTHEPASGARTRVDGRILINFSSYNYLGLNEHPEVRRAAKAQIDLNGVSPGASRHVGGERAIHLELERKLADLYGADGAVTFVSGYSTNVGVIGGLLGPEDLIIVDSAVHNSAVTGAALSGAQRRIFPHSELDALESILASNRHRAQRVLIAVEGVFGMDGDIPDLPRLIDIKKRYGCWLMVDEAHSLGVIGPRGFGVADHFGIDPREVDIWMGTLSKTLSGCGGYIVGDAALILYLRSRVGSFVYSVAMAPVIAAAVAKALDILKREPERVARLQSLGATFQRIAREKGLETGTSAGTAVAPIFVPDAMKVVQLSQRLFERGVSVQPVFYPGVPLGASRLRFFLTYNHSEEDIEQALEITAQELERLSK